MPKHNPTRIQHLLGVLNASENGMSGNKSVREAANLSYIEDKLRSMLSKDAAREMSYDLNLRRLEGDSSEDQATAISRMKKGGKTASKTKPALWKRIVARVKAGTKGGKAGQWSARKAQLATQQYKKAGGGYRGKKSSSNSLSKWTKQKWRTSDGKPSKGKKRYLPDKAWKALSKAEKAATNRAKSKGNKKGKQFVKQPKKIAKKTAKYRK